VLVDEVVLFSLLVISPSKAPKDVDKQTWCIDVLRFFLPHGEGMERLLERDSWGMLSIE
jgi:hypothetical protein